MCLKESCFLDRWKVSLVVPVFLKIFGKGLQLKFTSPIGFFLWLEMSLKNVDLLKVASDSIARAFNRSGTTLAIALDISKSFDRVWHAGFLQKPKSYKVSGQIFDLILPFLSNRRLQAVLDGRKSKNFHKNLSD